MPRRAWRYQQVSKVDGADGSSRTVTRPAELRPKGEASGDRRPVGDRVVVSNRPPPDVEKQAALLAAAQRASGRPLPSESGGGGGPIPARPTRREPGIARRFQGGVVTVLSVFWMPPLLVGSTLTNVGKSALQGKFRPGQDFKDGLGYTTGTFGKYLEVAQGREP